MKIEAVQEGQTVAIRLDDICIGFVVMKEKIIYFEPTSMFTNFDFTGGDMYKLYQAVIAGKKLRNQIA